MSRVAVVFGGRSVEHEVSVRSARTVSRGLTEAGHEVIPLGIAPDGRWTPRAPAEAALAGELDRLPVAAGEEAPATVAASLGPLLEADAEVVFPLVHGTWGEDGSLQGFFEILDLPYVGAGVTTSALAMDKILAKRQLAAAGLPVVPGEGLDATTFEDSPEHCWRLLRPLGRPLFVKPAVGGSSVGVSRACWPDSPAVPAEGGTLPGPLAEAVEHALRFDRRVLVEKAVVAARELECAVLGPGPSADRLEASVVGEIIPGNDFYDYADKYLTDGAHLVAPARVEPALAERVQDLACRAFAALAGEGMARVDFLLAPASGGGGEDEGELWINEINTLPGFTEISMYPRLWDLSGLRLSALVDRLVELARERHGRRRRLDEGIEGWLEELG